MPKQMPTLEQMKNKHNRENAQYEDMLNRLYSYEQNDYFKYRKEGKLHYESMDKIINER